MPYTKVELLAILQAQCDLFAAPTLIDELKAAIGAADGDVGAIEKLFSEKMLAATLKAGFKNVTPMTIREAVLQLEGDAEVMELHAKNQAKIGSIMQALGMSDDSD